MCLQVISISKQFGKPMIVVLKTRITKIKGRPEAEGRPEAVKFNLILSLDYAIIKCYEAS